MAKSGFIKVFLITAVLSSLSVVCFAQEKPPRSNTIDQNPKVDIKKEAPKVKKPKEIIKNDTRGILYGNRCFEEYTRSKGYIYVIQPQPNPTFKARYKKSWHNFGVKLLITLKYSIFWKAIERKRMIDCRLKTGDRIG